jgi:hypothetical protein
MELTRVGYFVSISKTYKHVFVYRVLYRINPDRSFYLSGIWKPTTLENYDEKNMLLIRNPGYHLEIQKLEGNGYFEMFCKTSDVSANGWTQGKCEYPYKVTRFKNDRMFLLLAENLRVQPIDVKKKYLFKAFRRSGIPLDAKIHFL